MTLVKGGLVKKQEFFSSKKICHLLLLAWLNMNFTILRPSIPVVISNWKLIISNTGSFVAILYMEDEADCK
jgi:hypothetical protein